MYKQAIILAITSTAYAWYNPWYEDFDTMLLKVNCRNGPKKCGINKDNKDGFYCPTYSGCIQEGLSEWGEVCD